MQEEKKMTVNRGSPSNGFFQYKSRLVLVGFLAISAFFLLTEHTAPVFGALPFILLLACPLLHLFIHGGHGSPAGGGESHGSHGGKQ